MSVGEDSETNSSALQSVHSDPVLIFQASTQEELEVVRATIEAAGIHAFLDQSSSDPVVGALDPSIDSGWRRGVYVRAADADAARALVDDMPITEAELDAEEQADPTTLLEAEQRANAQ
jgi:hypothetical protein